MSTTVDSRSNASQWQRRARRRLKLIRFRVWSLWSRRFHGESRWVTLEGGEKLCVLTSDLRGWRIASRRGTQQALVRAWTGLCTLRPDLVVDVGANYGEFSCVVADGSVPVLALEPNAAVCACLARSVASRSNVVVENVAAAAHDGVVSLLVDGRETGRSTVETSDKRMESFKRPSPGTSAAIEVQARSLTGLIRQHFPSVASIVMKVDVEGYEPEVFKGAQDVLDRCDWWVLLCEFNRPAIERAGGDPWQLWRWLASHSGAMTLARDSSPASLPPEPPQGSTDVVVWARRRAEEILAALRASGQPRRSVGQSG